MTASSKNSKGIAEVSAALRAIVPLYFLPGPEFGDRLLYGPDNNGHPAVSPPHKRHTTAPSFAPSQNPYFAIG
jgi:hypothetical protein